MQLNPQTIKRFMFIKNAQLTKEELNLLLNQCRCIVNQNKSNNQPSRKLNRKL